MITNPRRLLLGLPLMASVLPGCGCGRNRQVFYQERPGNPIQVDTRDGVHVRAPFVDVRVPARKGMTAGQVDVPIVEPD